MRNITWFSKRNHCLLTLRSFMIINHTSVKMIFSFQQNGSFDTFDFNKSHRKSQTSNIYSEAEIFQVAFYGLHGTNWNKSQQWFTDPVSQMALSGSAVWLLVPGYRDCCHFDFHTTDHTLPIVRSCSVLCVVCSEMYEVSFPVSTYFKPTAVIDKMCYRQCIKPPTWWVNVFRFIRLFWISLSNQS